MSLELDFPVSRLVSPPNQERGENFLSLSCSILGGSSHIDWCKLKKKFGAFKALSICDEKFLRNIDKAFKKSKREILSNEFVISRSANSDSEIIHCD